MDTARAIETSAEKILSGDPDPVVRHLLMRDVLRRPPDGREMKASRKALDGSQWVQLPAAEQHEDGGWGRFHSQDYRSRQKTVTTEFGVERALSLGVEPDHPILRKASRYIVGILEGKTPFPDAAEKNDRWPVGVRMFAGATLARVQPNLPVLAPVWERWADIVCRVFLEGKFSAEAEVQAHRDLHAIQDDVSYLSLRNRYAVYLIGSRVDELPRKIERAYVHWLWNHPSGLGYIDARLWPPPARTPRGLRIGGQLGSMELLASFPSWRELAGEFVEWLWDQRNEAGMWDFGPGSGWPVNFHLSESWRKKPNRQYDCSTRVLVILARYYDVR